MPSTALETAPEQFQLLIDEWARSLAAEGKSKRTIRCYTDSARWLHIWLASPVAPPDVDSDWLDAVPEPPTEPTDVTPRHIKAWITYRLGTTSHGNANNNYRALQQWFNWLADEDEIDAHPMARMKPPAVPEQPVPVISDDLVKRVLDQCAGSDFLSRRDDAIIRLIWDTGARLSEIANLTLDDLDLGIDVINVVGKGGKGRAIPFSPKTGKSLARYLRVRRRQARADEPRLWLADRNRGTLSDNGIKLMLRRRGREAGVNAELGRNLHAHLGRHAIAHHWQLRGGNPNELMLIMGWTTPQMAARYGKSAATERAHNTSRRLRLGDRL
ncbi:tyrosine-type recombinase/integrase [Amycolatopsis magusensis]|uniref:tyrosine-type recombinase/integrase n=1 Tax=Amycolatopsis magusensis TaxID=882444 RepID=UPI0037A3F99F